MPAADTNMQSAPAPRYNMTAIALHWLLALAILGSLVVGFYMADLPFSPLRLKLFNWHKWAGITILTLSAARLSWRIAHKPPELPVDVLAAMPGWQRHAHRATHAALYLLSFALPLSGWAYSSAAGFPIVWFGVLPLPDFVPKDKALAELLKQAHELLAWGLALLVIAHLAAALKHHFIEKDGLLHRMLPRVS